jgi:hypothetical protein
MEIAERRISLIACFSKITAHRPIGISNQVQLHAILDRFA